MQLHAVPSKVIDNYESRHVLQRIFAQAVQMLPITVGFANTSSPADTCLARSSQEGRMTFVVQL